MLGTDETEPVTRLKVSAGQEGARPVLRESRWSIEVECGLGLNHLLGGIDKELWRETSESFKSAAVTFGKA